MTPQEIHEKLCKCDDATKMRLAAACYLNGTTVESVEKLLATVITGIENSMNPVIEQYRYLGGGVDSGKY